MYHVYRITTIRPLCLRILQILNAGDEDTEIGAIEKKWTGFGAEYFTDADTFSVSCELRKFVIKVP